MNKYELYKKYRGLIFKVMKDLNCQWKTQDEWQELYDAGEIGLLRAINNLDDRGLSTKYFYIYIKHSLTTYFYHKTMPKRYTDKLPVSLEKEVGTDRYLYEVLPDETNIESELIKQEQINTIKKALNLIKPKYRDILIKYYYQDYELRELGQIYNTTYQNIFAIKKNALKHLKIKYLELGGIDER